MPLPATTPPRRMLLLSVLAAVIGVGGGLVGFVFVRVTALLMNVTLQHQVGWHFPSVDQVAAPWTLPFLGAAGGLVVAALVRVEPLIRGHGTPEAMEAVLLHQSRISVRTAVVKPVATIVAIGTGAPFGAEGPIIVTGGALGSLLGQSIRVSPAERKVLLAAGAAAGMAAIFGAPIGAVLLSIELLLFEFSPRVFLPLVIAAVFADGVHVLVFGDGPLFDVPAHDFAGLGKLPLYLVLGVAAGLLGVVITKGAFGMEDAFKRLPVSGFWHPMIGGVVVGTIGIAIPRVLGVGYSVIGETLGDRLAVGALAAVFIGKLVAWCVAIGSGTSGSSVAPVLLIGSSAGCLVGTGLQALGADVSPGAFAVVGMAATFGATAGTPFTAIVLVSEVTRDYNVILPLMFATVLADLLARSLSTDTLMTEKLTRRGIRVSSRYQVDLQRITTVRQVMTGDVDVVAPDTPVSDLRRRLAGAGHHAYPVVDDGRCVGIVTESDVLRRTDDAGTAMDVGSRDLVTVAPATTVFDAVQHLMHEEVRQLPVIDGDRLVGMFSRFDALRVSEIQVEREQTQRGWLRVLLDRDRPS